MLIEFFSRSLSTFFAHSGFSPSTMTFRNSGSDSPFSSVRYIISLYVPTFRSLLTVAVTAPISCGAIMSL